MADSLGDKPFYLAFNRVKGIGPARLRLLLSHFGSLADAWQASPLQLAGAGLDQKSIDALVSTRQSIAPAREQDMLERTGIRALTWVDPDYPRLLRPLDDAPPVLYLRGALVDADEWAVAIVGTRRATVYGQAVAEMLAAELARNHVTVVSGMARGIDAVAHHAALDAGGRTIAVLGCGVDVVYPPEHRKLAQRIIEHGALVSDYPPGTQPEAGNFPPRNRLISGLSLGVVVVEADEQSGALITAHFAADQGRDVFAVPGNILNRSSRGANRLIQRGAKLVLDTADILEELNLGAVAEHVEAQAILPQNDAERALLARLSHEPTRADELVRELGLPAEVVTATLAMMELKGMVRQAGGTTFVLARESRPLYKVD
ncbi:MAG: DNA-processing protein DprA [Anaerolineae bacterium]|nr:DNA-processing protein DprA [Thermoflexales bacterium]MDW8406994.1 DNA-processing protein DprA [Anaerolineae bacterium]